VKKKRAAPQFRPRAALAALLLAAAASSCSQSAPRISSLSVRLVYRWVDGRAAERLSLFVYGADEDGDADLEELHLLNDEAQLHWSMASGDWISAERSGDAWIGAHALAMPGGDQFPRGVYRVVLVDKGGQRAERVFSLDQDLAPGRPFPTLSFAEGRYRVASSYPKNSLVVYDAAGAGIRTVLLKTAEGAVSDLGLPTGARSAALWAEDEGNLTAALTEPAALPPLDEGKARP
jgi:hypothetical protein